jgi:hypothetical protein
LGFARKGNDIDATQCRQCTLGETTTMEGAATCSGCDLGSYGSAKGTCSACPAGQYQDGKGETSCKECDADTYLNEQGKSSKADCDACSEEKSTGASMGNTNAASCLCRKEDYYQQGAGVCQACPNGADCGLQNGIRLPQLVAVNGFWYVFSFDLFILNTTSTDFANSCLLFSSLLSLPHNPPHQASITQLVRLQRLPTRLFRCKPSVGVDTLLPFR